MLPEVTCITAQTLLLIPRRTLPGAAKVAYFDQLPIASHPLAQITALAALARAHKGKRDFQSESWRGRGKARSVSYI